MTFTAQILTLYPEMFPGPLGVSLAGRALTEGKWACDPIQIRDFAADKHRTVDDTPAGGGAGMVLRADVLGKAVDHALDKRPDLPVLAMTPRGRPITRHEKVRRFDVAREESRVNVRSRTTLYNPNSNPGYTEVGGARGVDMSQWLALAARCGAADGP